MSDVCKACPELPPEIIDYIEVLEGSNKTMAADYINLEAENQRMKAIIGNIIAAYEGNHAYVDVAEEIEIAKQEIEK